MRSWVVIPAMGAVAGGAAVALGLTPWLALAGAALAAVIRVVAGDAPGALCGAVLAPSLAVASLADASPPSVRGVIALAAACWVVVELARAPESAIAARLAVFPAVVAAVLDPSFVALVAITGLHLWMARGPRWSLAALVLGCVAVGVALLAGTVWTGLGAHWFAAPAHAVPSATLAARIGDALGPLTAVAALAGLSALVRVRFAELALAAGVVGALLVDARAGGPSTATLGLAALLAGLAIDRLAGLIRIPAGQAITGATVAALVVLPPAWTAVEQRIGPQIDPQIDPRIGQRITASART